MTRMDNGKRWRPTRVQLVGAVLVIAGLQLTSLSWWFFVLVGLGMFGPGVLRELGWLSDQDEFQRGAAHRAGYHAFLATGIAACVWMAFFRSGPRAVEDAQNLAQFFLALLWFSWLLSSLLSFWGPRKTASRILVVFGLVWLIFLILSNTGPEWTGWAALLLHPLLALPFFVLARLSGRWPRISGVILLGITVFFLRFFGLAESVREVDVDGISVAILFIGPLFASGVALLAARAEAAIEPDSL